MSSVLQRILVPPLDAQVEDLVRGGPERVALVFGVLSLIPDTSAYDFEDLKSRIIAFVARMKLDFTDEDLRLILDTARTFRSPSEGPPRIDLWSLLE